MKVVTGFENDENDYLKILVYGDPGSGKTTFAATACDIPEMNDVLFIDAEKGKLSIPNSGIVKNHENIDFVGANNYEEFTEVYETLRDHLQLLENNEFDKLEKYNKRHGIAEDRKYQTVIVDSLTVIDLASFNRIQGVSTAKLTSLPTKKNDWSEYALNKTSMTKLLTEFRNLNINIIMTAAATLKPKIKDGEEFYMPDLVGSSREAVKHYFDGVYFMQNVVGITKEITPIFTDDMTGIEKRAERKRVKQLNSNTDNKLKRKLFLQSQDNIYGKSRITPQHLIKINEPTIKKIMEIKNNDQSN